LASNHNGAEDPVPRRTGRWSPDEQVRYRQALKKHGKGAWAAIAKEVPGRSNRQCLQQYPRHFMEGVGDGDGDDHDEGDGEKDDNEASLASNHNGAEDPVPRRTGRWSPDELDLFRQALEKHGKGAWTAIAKEVQSRTPAQCRCHHDRYGGMDPLKKRVSIFKCVYFDHIDEESGKPVFVGKVKFQPLTGTATLWESDPSTSQTWCAEAAREQKVKQGTQDSTDPELARWPVDTLIYTLEELKILQPLPSSTFTTLLNERCETSNQVHQKSLFHATPMAVWEDDISHDLSEVTNYTLRNMSAMHQGLEPGAAKKRWLWATRKWLGALGHLSKPDKERFRGRRGFAVIEIFKSHLQHGDFGRRFGVAFRARGEFVLDCPLLLNPADHGKTWFLHTITGDGVSA